jgi:phosphonoacetaldehyde dehydrogenase
VHWGGNDPLIVMEDMDPHWAAALAVTGAYKNLDQCCTAVKRVVVIDTVTDAFVETVAARAKTLTCSDPMDPNTDIWKVVDSAAAMLSASWVNDTISAGVTLLCGPVR